jgi:pentatricopeptide repeat protein
MANIHIKNRRDMPSALNVLDQIMQLAGKPTALQMTILIHGYGLTGDMEGACEMLNKMIEIGIHPILETYNSLMFNSTMNNQPEETIRWYSELLKAGLKPNHSTFNILMVCFGRQNNETASLDIYKSIVDNGFTPTHHTVTSLTFFYTKQKKVAEARAFQEKMFKMFPETAQSIQPHNVILSALKDQGDLETMVDEFNLATKKYKVEPSITTYELLIRAHGADHVEGAEKWYTEAAVKFRRTMDARLFAALMSVYREAKNDTKIKALYDDMVSRGIAANVEVSSIMASVWERDPQSRPAEQNGSAGDQSGRTLEPSNSS